MCDNYGADTLRVYEMSMGPLEASRPWATKDVVGAHRFLQRVWRLVVDENSGEVRAADGSDLDTDTLRLLHKTIAGVAEDYAALRNNTAVAKLIEYTNHLTKQHLDGVPRAAVEPLVLMLAPVAPHLAEELWQRLGNATSLVHGPFPVVDPAYLVEETVEYPVQVNGKVRGRITVPADADADAVEAAALADEKVQTSLAGATPKKVIVVAGRLVNLVGLARFLLGPFRPPWSTSWSDHHFVDMPVRRGGHRLGDRRGNGVRFEEPGGIVFAALERHQRLLHVGIHTTGIDRRHPKVWFALAQRIGERAERELARRVRRHGRRCLAAGAGVDEDDLATSASERGQQRQRNSNCTNNIHLERGAPVLDGRVGDRPREEDAGVVDQHVELTDRGGGSCDRVGVGHIQRQRRGAEPLGSCLQRRRRSSGQQQGVRRCQGRGDGCADPTAGTGNERGPHA